MNSTEITDLLKFVESLNGATEETGVIVVGSLTTTSGDDTFNICWDEDRGEYQVTVP
jgi:hypothetical protein